MIIVVRRQNEEIVIDTARVYDLCMTADAHMFWGRISDALMPYVEDQNKFEFIDTNSGRLVDLSVYKDRDGLWCAHSVEKQNVVVHLLGKSDRIFMFRDILDRTFA